MKNGITVQRVVDVLYRDIVSGCVIFAWIGVDFLPGSFCPVGAELDHVLKPFLVTVCLTAFAITTFDVWVQIQWYNYIFALVFFLEHDILL